MSIEAPFALTLAVDQSFYILIFVLYLWERTSIEYHGIHPAFLYGALCLSSLALWLPPTLAYRQHFGQCIAEQTALFLCLRLNTAFELYKIWMLTKDLEDTQGPRCATAPLLLQIPYILLALLEALFAVKNQTTFARLVYWNVLDLVFDIWYVVRVIQYRASQRQQRKIAFHISEVVLCAVVSTLKNVYTPLTSPFEPSKIRLVQVNTGILQNTFIAYFSEPTWRKWLRGRYALISRSEDDASQPLLRD